MTAFPHETEAAARARERGIDLERSYERFLAEIRVKPPPKLMRNLGLSPSGGLVFMRYRGIATTCKACGVPLDEKTVGCRNCQRRHRERKTPAWQKEAA